jgi:hypothetical protein
LVIRLEYFLLIDKRSLQVEINYILTSNMFTRIPYGKLGTFKKIEACHSSETAQFISTEIVISLI